MKDRPRLTPGSMSRPDRVPLAHVDSRDLMPLRAPLDDPARERPWPPLPAQATARYECILDDTCAVSIPKPAGKDEEDALVRAFLSGLDKLFTRENNWTFLQPLLLSMEHCARCQTCAASCHIFEASGRNEVYRPTFRSDVMRRLYFKCVKHGGMLSAWRHGDIEVNWPLVARLIELAYRCNLCRRCAQTC
ncbi:MAG: 4Fe-4S dicluster domain-containing protein, partial [Rhodospirillaceae bacterium]